LVEGAVLATADLLIKVLMTLDKWPTVVDLVFLAQVTDQCLQHRRDPYGVRRSYGIMQSLEQSHIRLVMLGHSRKVPAVVALVERELYVNGVVTFRPARPELRVLARVFSGFPKKGDVGDTESQAGAEAVFKVPPYVGDVAVRLREKVLPRHK